MCLCVWDIDVTKCNVLLVDFSFDEYVVFFPILTSFGLKSVLLEIRIGVPACFFIPFAWTMSSHFLAKG